MYFETFEGHTIFPAIRNFIEAHRVEAFTVVADAAMMRTDNVKEFHPHNINNIVGARLANVSAELLAQTDRDIRRKDGKHIRLKTDRGNLICSYSSVRYRKDL